MEAMIGEMRENAAKAIIAGFCFRTEIVKVIVVTKIAIVLNH